MAILAGVVLTLCAAGLHPAKAEDTNTADSVFASATPDREVLCLLKYKPGGFNLNIWARADTTMKETNGPDFGKRAVNRGVIPGNAADAKSMLFVWDKTKGKLYFDLNNNLDLTDDINGVFSSKAEGIGSFDEMRIERQFGDVRVPYIIRAMLFTGNYNQFTVHSGFEGEAELEGKRYRVLLADNMDGTAGEGDYFAISSADSNFRPPTNDMDVFAPKEVFLDGHNWAISYEFATVDGQACVRAIFKESPKETGKIKIEGKFIRYLMLRNGQSITVFENPEGEVAAPTGNHILCQLYLDGGKAGLFEKRISSRDFLNVRKDQTETLKAGGPLNNGVEVERIGRILQFSYKLVGADGKEYTSKNRDEENAPKFAVYKGDREIDSGTFQFG